MAQRIERKYKCHDCGANMTKENRVEVRTPYKAFVCKKCAEEGYGKCENCNHLVDSEYIAYSGSVQCCDKCAGKIREWTRMSNPIW